VNSTKFLEKTFRHSLLNWRWRQHVPMKQQSQYTKLHVFILTAMKTSKLNFTLWLHHNNIFTQCYSNAVIIILSDKYHCRSLLAYHINIAQPTAHVLSLTHTHTHTHVWWNSSRSGKQHLSDKIKHLCKLYIAQKPRPTRCTITIKVFNSDCASSWSWFFIYTRCTVKTILNVYYCLALGSIKYKIVNYMKWLTMVTYYFC
jgi:hypothetical protein